MRYHVTLYGVETIGELPGYWTEADYRALLAALDFAEADEVPAAEVWEYLQLAVRELEPPAAAEVVLTYKLADELSAGQIQQIAHEMPDDAVAEEYPDIHLHHALYACNELLYRAYNGRFPKPKASVIDCAIVPARAEPEGLDARAVVRALGAGLNDHAVITRLLGEQLRGEAPFESAADIVWTLDPVAGEPNRYHVTTSDYWISEEDFGSGEWDAEVREYAGGGDD